MNRLTLIFALALGLAAPLFAKGPPWIRVTLPADHDLAVRRGQFLLVHTFHHGTAAPLTLTGTAEGLIGGSRTSVALRFVTDTTGAGQFLLPRTWATGGPVVLNIGSPDEHGGAGVVVGLDPAGRPVLVETPRTATGVSRPATAREVNQLLAHLAGQRAMPALQDARWRVIFTIPGAVGAAVLMLPVLLLALLLRRLRRARRLSGSPLAERRLSAAG